MTEFSKKTGDYASLSATDIRVMAVTYMLETQHVGTNHLREEPLMKPTVNFYTPAQIQERSNASSQGTEKSLPITAADLKLAGFYKPNEEDKDETTESEERETKEEERKV